MLQDQGEKKIRNDFQKAHVVFIECFNIKCTDNEPTLIDVLVVFCDTKSRIKMSSAKIYVIISIFLRFSVTGCGSIIDVQIRKMD